MLQAKKYHIDALNERLQNKTYHVMIVKTFQKERNSRGEQLYRLTISTITEATPALPQPEQILAIEAAPTAIPTTDSAPATNTEELTPIAATPPDPIQLATIPEQPTTKAENITDRKNLVQEKHTKRSLEAEFAEKEKQFQKNIKAESSSKGNKPSGTSP